VKFCQLITSLSVILPPTLSDETQTWVSEVWF